MRARRWNVLAAPLAAAACVFATLGVAPSAQADRFPDEENRAAACSTKFDAPYGKDPNFRVLRPRAASKWVQQTIASREVETCLLIDRNRQPQFVRITAKVKKATKPSVAAQIVQVRFAADNTATKGDHWVVTYSNFRKKAYVQYQSPNRKRGPARTLAASSKEWNTRANTIRIYLPYRAIFGKKLQYVPEYATYRFAARPGATLSKAASMDSMRGHEFHLFGM